MRMALVSTTGVILSPRSLSTNPQARDEIPGPRHPGGGICVRPAEEKIAVAVATYMPYSGDRNCPAHSPHESRGSGESVGRGYVIGALSLGGVVPLLPIVGWMLGGLPLSPGGLWWFLVISTGHLAVVTVVAVTCAVMGLRRFARDLDVGGHDVPGRQFGARLQHLATDAGFTARRMRDES